MLVNVEGQGYELPALHACNDRVGSNMTSDISIGKDKYNSEAAKPRRETNALDKAI